MSRQYASEDERSITVLYLLTCFRSGSLESSYDEYDDEFYGNEDDRAYLYSLPDVERESILYERSEQRKEREERRRIRRQARGERDVPRSAPKSVYPATINLLPIYFSPLIPSCNALH